MALEEPVYEPGEDKEAKAYSNAQQKNQPTKPKSLLYAHPYSLLLPAFESRGVTALHRKVGGPRFAKQYDLPKVL
jgi:hypothetical protein